MSSTTLEETRNALPYIAREWASAFSDEELLDETERLEVATDEACAKARLAALACGVRGLSKALHAQRESRFGVSA